MCLGNEGRKKLFSLWFIKNPKEKGIQNNLITWVFHLVSSMFHYISQEESSNIMNNPCIAQIMIFPKITCFLSGFLTKMDFACLAWWVEKELLMDFCSYLHPVKEKEWMSNWRACLLTKNNTFCSSDGFTIPPISWQWLGLESLITPLSTVWFCSRITTLANFWSNSSFCT